jgi:ACDE family multidrug resistance protein
VTTGARASASPFGPLVGGELGGISWRGPFFGVSVLMTISLVATLLFVEPTPRSPRKISITEPLRALRHRALTIMSITALGYNWGFFTLLAYTPFPMHLGVHELGYVFTGWGSWWRSSPYSSPRACRPGSARPAPCT